MRTDLSPDSSTETIEQTEYPLPDSIAPTLGEADRPESIQAFQDEFTRLFNEDIYTPFIELGDWQDVDESSVIEYLTHVRKAFTWPGKPGRFELTDPATDLEIETVEDYGYGGFIPLDDEATVQLIPPATHVIGVTGHLSDSTSSTSYFAIGLKGGRYYFCRPAESAPE